MRSFKYVFLVSIFFITLSCGEVTEKEQQETEAITENASEESKDTKTILFFGDSITAGYGLEEGEAFPTLIQQRIDSLDLNYEVVNAGLSGETTAGGLNRIDWVLKQNVDVFILELGANDGLRGLPLDETRKNLNNIIDFVQQENPDAKIILAGMQLPPNLGADYTREFNEIFPELAEKENVSIIPFILEGVAGDPILNQQDGIHPTAEAQSVLADNVWEVLGPILQE